MTVEQALAVHWKRNDVTPTRLGDQIAEGSCTKDDLEWLLHKGLTEKLREAASVLLRDKRYPTGTVTLEQARVMIYPSSDRSQRQPMGRLLESKAITLGDLERVVIKTNNERLRQAAQLMIKAHTAVTQMPAEQARGHVKIYSGGRTYAQQLEFYVEKLYWTFFGMFNGIILTLLVVWTLQPRAEQNPELMVRFNNSPIETKVLVYGVAGAILLTMYVVGTKFPEFITERARKRVDKYVARLRRGQIGEERVALILAQTLDSKWTMFRNIRLPGREKADLDTVLVSNQGIWVLEIKSYIGEYRNNFAKWEVRTAKGWKPIRKNPSEQVKKAAGALQTFLKPNNVKWVDGIIVWADPNSHLTVDSPERDVWKLEEVSLNAQSLTGKYGLNTTAHEQVVEKLIALCRQGDDQSEESSDDH